MNSLAVGTLILALFAGGVPSVPSGMDMPTNAYPAVDACRSCLAQGSRDRTEAGTGEATDPEHEETVYPLVPTRSYEDPDHPTPAWMHELASTEPRIVALGRFSQLPLAKQLEFAAFMRRNTEPSDIQWEREVFSYAGPALRSALVKLINEERSEGFVLTYLDMVRDAARSSLISNPRSFRAAIAGRLAALQKGWAKTLAEQTLAEISKQQSALRWPPPRAPQQ